MSNLFSSFKECLGFSQIMKLDSFKMLIALIVISSRFPIGVETIYKPFFKSTILILLTIIISCSPQNYSILQEDSQEDQNLVSIDNNDQKTNEVKKIQNTNFEKSNVLGNVEILLPKHLNSDITQNLLNAFELSIYVKQIKNINLSINFYENKEDLEKIILKKSDPGKIFIGPLTSNDTKNLSKYCDSGIIIFSFASNRKLAGECIYLVNFFPEDDIRAIFNTFDTNSKVALLYPENDYGKYINKIIESLPENKKSFLVNKASYNEDLTNARNAIKKLSKYEIRKEEIERQKKILKSKTDEVSKKALRKLQNFETAGVVDFTHIILPDYGIRLLQIAPLLPFYDIDPKKVQLIGTGVWDDKVFFSDPTLQGSIFPGVVEKKRNEYFNQYLINYKNKPIRTITIPYDLVGIISYVIDSKMNLKKVYQILDNGNIQFDGIDGKFLFKNNIISRDLKMLRIVNGSAILNK